MTARTSKISRKKSTSSSGKKKNRSAKRPPGPKRVRAFRLDPTLRPSNVDLAVELDPHKSTVFRGEISIDLESGRRRKIIELHAAELRVTRARVETSDRTLRGKIEAHPERETLKIHFPALLPKGSIRLQLSFAGRLRKDLRGLYQAHAGGNRYAFTQLEASDARKFFPCFDEPAMKARFQISVTTALEHTVISNSPEASVDEWDDGTKTIHFERTAPLSTYLVALAVGDLECSRTTHAGPTPIRVWHVPGKHDLVAFGLEAAKESLVRLEDYFGMPYPYAKLDLVAVPDFEFGAMENAGAVFFRETLLLTDPTSVTLAERKRAAEVICHELAHMWFGNLVTMSWWDDLWLNEAFATWMAFWIVDRWKPEWKMWQDFQHHRAPALDLDGLRHTHSIYTPVATPEDANENFDVITYEKGASVVRMIEGYLGKATFRRGVRRYIRRHRESNAVASDLWRALEEASGENIESIARTWIEEPGFPVVTLRMRQLRGQAVLELAQERFLEIPLKGTGQRRPKWPIPWVGRIGRNTQKHLLTGRREQIPVTIRPHSTVYGNSEEIGFFHVQHGRKLHETLVNDPQKLSVIERIGWIGHQWALTRTGRAPLAPLLDLIDALASDRDADVLTSLLQPLSVLSERLAPDTPSTTQALLESWIRDRFTPLFEDMGWDSHRRESDGDRVRRAALLRISGRLGGEASLLREATRRCATYLSDRNSLDPNLSDIVVQLAASQGSERLYNRMHRASRRAHTPQEARRFLLALADFQESERTRQTLKLVLGDEVASQDVVFVLTRLLANSNSREQAWSFIQSHWPRLRHRIPPLLAGRLIEATPLLGTLQHRREVARFFRRNPLPSSDRALRQAMERFDSWDQFRRRIPEELESWLKRRPAESS